jgi:hypothetical protein
MILGRAMWELACIRFGIEVTETPIEDSHTVTETPTNNPMNPSGGSGVS